MRKGLLIGLVLVFGVVGCDNEEESVGAFTSSLSAEEATVQNLTFAQQSTFCSEFTAYSAAKGESLENDYGCFGALASAAEVTVEATDPCADADYVSCEATVLEVETCAEEFATFGYLSAAAALSGASDAAAGAEGGEMSIEIDLSALGVSCDAPTPTPISADCTAIAAKCPELFGADVSNDLPEVEAPEEGGEAAEEEGGEAAEEEGGEAAEEEGGEAAEEEGGEAAE